MMMRSLLAAIAAASLLIVSCKKEQGTASAADYAPYFPLQAGHYVIYEVDSIIWDDFNCSVRRDTVQMRYTVAEAFIDGEGRTSHPINIDQRAADSLPWQAFQTIYVTPAGQRLEYVEGNLRFIKLVSPVLEGSTWNGNAFINTADADLQYFSGWDYEYDAVGQPFDTERKTFTNTVTMLGTDQTQNNPEDMPEAYAYRTLSKEVFAQGVGLVHRQQIRWIYDPGPTNTPCRKGYSVTMRAFDNN